MRERRERILAAAHSIIAEVGYSGLSMRALAQASRVTVPTIYNLIGTKEDVVVGAVAEQMRGFVSRLEVQDDLLRLVQAALDDFIALPTPPDPHGAGVHHGMAVMNLPPGGA